MGIIEGYNKLFERVSKVANYEDVSTLAADVKEFVNDYESVDSDMTNRIYDRFMKRIDNLLLENENEFKKLNERVQSIKNRHYSYKGEENDIQAVQNRTLQLMAELPKEITSSNVGLIKNRLNATVTSGIIGSKAVLELLKYPAYASMVDEQIKANALVGSKSLRQQIFEENVANELKHSNEVLTEVYTQGFHLRRLKERITGKTQILKYH